MSPIKTVGCLFTCWVTLTQSDLNIISCALKYLNALEVIRVKGGFSGSL